MDDMTDLRRNWSETKLQAELIARAKELGWMRGHSRTARVQRQDGSVFHATPLSGDEGEPDLRLVRRGRAMILELKNDKGGMPSQKQADWLAEWSDGPSTRQAWRSRDAVPDGRALHLVGGWTSLDQAGDWSVLVALIRPRHYSWIVDQMAQGRNTPGR